MYETPKLIEVGRAEDVILGSLLQPGADADGLHFMPEFEFAEDD